MGGGGGFVSAITDPISSALGTDGGGGGLLGAVEDVGGFIGDAGEVIDKNVLQPALQDPAGTVVKIAAIAAAPATGGTSLYAIPAYTATKAIAAGVPIEDVAKMTAISAAATAAGVSVADYVGTLAEFGTEIGSQQTAMLAAQNVGIGTGGALSTAAGQVAGGAVSGAIGAGASGGDIGQGLLSGATNAAIGQGVNLGVDAGANLFNQNTGSTGMDGLFNTTGEDFNMGGGGLYGPNYSVIPGELGDIIQDANGNIVLSSGADIQAAQSLGFDTASLTNYAKQFGTQALRALLGSRGGSAGGAGAGGTGTQGGLLGAGANYFLSDAARRAIQSASQQSAQQQLEATRRAEAAASFRPVGVTTAFGQSNFGFDPVTGQLTSAGYTATPEVATQRQRLFTLGSEALPTTTDTATLQQQYLEQQRGLLAPSREQQLAQLRNRQYQRGTTGLATGGTVAGYAPNAAGLMATNPEMAAYYNALAREDATLAANAPTYAQNLLNQRIATGTNLFTQAGALETMAQQPLTLGAGLGTQASTAGARAGLYGLTGTQGAAQTQLYGNVAGASGQLGQTQGLLTGVSPYLQQAGNYVLNNWLA
ncbi:hypothetical protein UFOVP678_48 [uncultured Caudovirales phage]|uniref:Uncharacterized protein n=1 Tax=uncultured Caudovirales phage TaxID=2100421 RepID=A0A6J5NK20_9CAUD|nr:hypothetical protein UFOVP678_48 [uncultured Caudovirales phage]